MRCGVVCWELAVKRKMDGRESVASACHTDWGHGTRATLTHPSATYCGSHRQTGEMFFFLFNFFPGFF